MQNFNAIGPAVTEKQLRRKMCDTLQAARTTCHSKYWHDSALVPYTVEGMGVPTKEGSLSIGLSVPEIEASQKRDHGRPADLPAAHTQDFPLFSVETRSAFGLARNQ